MKVKVSIKGKKSGKSKLAVNKKLNQAPKVELKKVSVKVKGGKLKTKP